MRSNAPSRRREFLGGARAELPILLGVIPFGMIYGALAVSAGLPASTSLAMSSVVFAGSAQFITAQLIAQSTPWFVIILTAAIVNLRHVLYSASLAPYVQHLPLRWKAGLAYLLTDEAYAMAITRFHQPDRGGAFGHWYVLGAGLTLWVTWQLSTVVGVVAGALVPPAWSLDFALPLTFIAIVVPALKDRPAIATALVAGVMSVLAFSMPLKLSIVAATLCGIVAGLLAEAGNGWAHAKRKTE
jgi:4-azaleucine resistance transporter AzlC